MSTRSESTSAHRSKLRQFKNSEGLNSFASERGVREGNASPTENLNPDVLMLQPAHDRNRDDFIRRERRLGRVGAGFLIDLSIVALRLRYFADLGIESLQRWTAHRSGLDSNRRYRLLDAS